MAARIIIPLLWVNSQTRNVFLRHYSQVALLVKSTPANEGDSRDTGLIFESGRSPGGGHGNPHQYSCPGNPMDRGAWLVAVHRITQLDTTEATEHTGPGMPVYLLSLSPRRGMNMAFRSSIVCNSPVNARK